MIGDYEVSLETEDAEEIGATPNLSDPKQVKARNKKAFAREELRKRFMARLLSDRDGREWVFELLTFCKVYQSTFIPGDTHAMCLNEGKRNVGLLVLSQIPPDTLALMLKESSDYAF